MRALFEPSPVITNSNSNRKGSQGSRTRDSSPDTSWEPVSIGQKCVTLSRRRRRRLPLSGVVHVPWNKTRTRPRSWPTSVRLALKCRKATNKKWKGDGAGLGLAWLRHRQTHSSPSYCQAAGTHQAHPQHTPLEDSKATASPPFRAEGCNRRFLAPLKIRQQFNFRLLSSLVCHLGSPFQDHCSCHTLRIRNDPKASRR